MSGFFNIPRMREICLSNIAYFKQFGEVRDTPDGIQIFIDRGAKVLGVAHLDTVCKPKKKFFVDVKRNQVFTPTLDDRLGVTILLDILPRVLGQNEFDVLLTEGEEMGLSTAAWFEPTRDYNWMFSFDRTGVDAVHYQYNENQKWVKTLQTDLGGMKLSPGLFSDISVLDHLKCSGVNIGCAYYKYHSPNAFANLWQTKSQVEKFCAFFHQHKDTHFEHIYEGRLLDVDFEFESVDDDLNYASGGLWCDYCGNSSGDTIRVIGGYDLCRYCFYNQDFQAEFDDDILRDEIDLWEKANRQIITPYSDD